MAQTVPRSEIGLCSAVIPRIRTAPPVLRFYGHVQMLLPDGSICEILLIFYDFCGQESFMLPFFPAHHFFFFFVSVPFRIFLLSALLVFVNFLWS